MNAVWEQGMARLLGRTPPVPGIDLGDGAVLGPEDVLETHFQRMARRRPASYAPRMRTVPVQVGDNLVAAITVLAPQLAPLTELAEDVAATVAPVQPGPAFRSSLHHALEQTHRQQAAQRVLGTRKPTRRGHADRVAGGLLVLLGAAVFLALACAWWARRRTRGA